MMRFILALTCSLVLSQSAFSGTKLKVKEGEVKFDDGKVNALTVEIFGVVEKDVVKAWAKKMKDLKGKVKKSKHGVKAEGVLMSQVHPFQAVFLAKTKTKDQTVTFSVAVNLGGAYLNSKDHSSSYKALETEIQNFAREVLLDQVEKELKDAERALKKEEKRLEDLKKRKEKLQKNIAGWKEDIKQAEADIKTNEGDQKTQVDAIEKKKQALEEIKKKKAQI